jgi:hypothetical protein
MPLLTFFGRSCQPVVRKRGSQEVAFQPVELVRHCCEFRGEGHLRNAAGRGLRAFGIVLATIEEEQARDRHQPSV